MTRPFRLGVLTRVYAPDSSPRVLHDTLALIEAAEALGFDSAWVAQHHFGSETGRLPSPLVLLAAAARRTRRIALGTGVIVLPLESALRVAEDAAVLDALAGGRLQLGVGAGFEADVFAAFGRDFGARAALQADALAALRRALDGAPVGPAGATLQPPAPTLAARLWQATGDAEAVARNGHGLIVARTRPEQDGEATLTARYRRAWAHPGAPRVALVRAVVPGADAASVEAALGPNILRYAARLAAAGGAPAPAPADLPALLDRFGVLRGTPADIAAALQTDPALADATELVVQVQTAGTSHRDALRRLEAVAREIAPALGWTPAAAGAEAASLTSDPIPT
ncbi:LLM class flavin-dependent oxidoreductase [Burkholderia sp. IDO3]|uniref:LLM class flavin-dependent oxidoreductase n=1 Tax=Burkholderia sp. IDO3 TaxID=1705310 RepID=UPI000BBB2F8C|nr:LLM class flavin-dependent oxidoreductase [Burkholderia sp. IDO3]AXK67461.1 LLM class flavin-dependent oxidoreductase [Burkholderia sp. IDO3]PCD60093.1 LLM class flavin-dependent oxidoreductase [Burkholderia sp. IDO3]